MHKQILFIAALFASVCSYGQAQVTEPDKSPMDMSYSPQGYPILKFQNKSLDGKLNARIIYSRPQVKGRTIFGGEVKYREIWRLGANESTEIDLYKNAVIGGKKIAKGRYTLFCIPDESKWTIILNKDTDSWGAFSYDEALDVVRTDVSVVKNDTPVEYLTIYFDGANNLVVMWADLKASLPIQFVTK
jgi:hypothetical protein